MLYQIIIPPFLIFPLMMTTKCNHNDKNQTDVIVTYSNHAEAKDNRPKIAPKTEAKPQIQILMPEKYIENNPAFAAQSGKKSETEEGDSSEVVFVPNEKAIVRNEEYLSKNPVRVEDYLVRKTVDDVMANGYVRVETEAPKDIIFMSGKNNENVNKAERKKEEIHDDARRRGSETNIDKPHSVKLNCSNLDCNNTVESVCGGKMEHKQWRYRLFLNDCFFRKVNCYFKHEVNRYHIVKLERCNNVGAHAPKPEGYEMYMYPHNSFLYSYPAHRREKTKPVKMDLSRRNIPSRRSMSVRMDGQSCAHPCPVACPDDYEPECAISASGKRKVFENHCKLDFNSCAFNVVWRKRPLSECVGGKMADMRQNRGFIDWMQRVGIVDNKGRLVLS